MNCIILFSRNTQLLLEHNDYGLVLGPLTLTKNTRERTKMKEGRKSHLIASISVSNLDFLKWMYILLWSIFNQNGNTVCIITPNFSLKLTIFIIPDIFFPLLLYLTCITAILLVKVNFHPHSEGFRCMITNFTLTSNNQF